MAKSYLCSLEVALQCKDVSKPVDDFIGTTHNRLTALFRVVSTDKGRDRLRYAFSCSCGNTIMTRKDSVLSGATQSCGCVKLEVISLKRLPLQHMIEKVKHNTSYDVVSCEQSTHSYWTFRCSKHGEFKSQWNTVANKRAHCPLCSSAGYKGVLAGTFYIHILSDGEGDRAIKYGITNCKIARRRYQTSLCTSLSVSTVFTISDKSGYLISDLEKEVKRAFGGYYLSPAEISNGYSETLPVDNLQIIKQFAENYIKENKYVNP